MNISSDNKKFLKFNQEDASGFLSFYVLQMYINHHGFSVRGII